MTGYCRCEGLAAPLSAELEVLSKLLCRLGEDLAADETILRQHFVSIQAIDRIVQSQLAIAAILGSDAPLDERLEAVPLEALRASLLERITPSGFAKF